MYYTTFWTHVWQGWLVLACTTALIFAGLSLAKAHPVKSYYLQSYSTTTAEAQYCVEADVDWSPDFSAFCSSSPEAAIGVYVHLTQPGSSQPQQ